MYITTMWIQAPSKDLAINVFAHPGFSEGVTLGAAPTVANAERVANAPAPEDRNLRRTQLLPLMNRVLAYVDIVLEDEPRDSLADRIRHALASHDASADDWAEHGGVFVRFFLQPYMGDRPGTFRMLQAHVELWLDQYFPNPLAAVG
jgi:hypothetical protein